MKVPEVVKRFSVPILFILVVLALALRLNMGIWPSGFGIFLGLVIWVIARKYRDPDFRKFFGGLALAGFVLPAMALGAFLVIALSVV